MINKKMREQYREEFNRWAIQRKLALDTSYNDLSICEVFVKNSYGIEIDPFMILGFSKEKPGYMYLDWDCWWFPISTERITKIVK